MECICGKLLPPGVFGLCTECAVKINALEEEKLTAKARAALRWTKPQRALDKHGIDD